MSNTITRRGFVRNAAMGAGAVAAMGAGTALADEPQDVQVGEALWTVDEPEAWDRECEMLVLGCGAGGCCALLEGYELGLDVLGIEKNNTVTDCNCARSGGWVCGCGTSLQKREGIEDSVDIFVKDIMADGGDMADEEVVRAWGEISGKTIDWLIDLGVDVIDRTFDAAKEVYSQAHSVARDYRANPAGNGIGWMLGLEAAINDYGIEILYNTEATKILRNDEGRVIGARAIAEDGSQINVKATKGVLVSTGGMGNNMDMWVKYCPMLKKVRDEADNIFFVGPSTITGDGINMLEEAGAWLWPTKSVVGNDVMTDPDYLTGTTQQLILTYIWQNSPVIVNKNGDRFYNETSFHDFMTDRPFMEQPGLCSFIIFDEAARLSEDGQIYAQWVIDAAPVLGREDLVFSANTIEELAEHFDLPVENVKAALADYNARVDSKEVDQFGREIFDVKYEQPPFWCVRTGVEMGTSKGGAKINAKGQVIDHFDHVIPNLYAAGEDAMFSAHGDAREHIVGGCNGLAMAYGRIAARNILEEEPWA